MPIFLTTLNMELLIFYIFASFSYSFLKIKNKICELLKD